MAFTLKMAEHLRLLCNLVANVKWSDNQSVSMGKVLHNKHFQRGLRQKKKKETRVCPLCYKTYLWQSNRGRPSLYSPGVGVKSR